MKPRDASASKAGEETTVHSVNITFRVPKFGNFQQQTWGGGGGGALNHTGQRWLVKKGGKKVGRYFFPSPSIDF